MAHTKNAKKEDRTPAWSSPRKGPSRAEEEAVTSGTPAQEVEVPTVPQGPQPHSPQPFVPAANPEEPTPGLSQAGSTSQASTTPQKAQRQESTSSTTPGKMYHTCPSCQRGNQLAMSDEHDCCISCLECGHLQQMASCIACQALCGKDRLERARRFTWWKRTGRLLSAKAIRELLRTTHPMPYCLERENLEPF